MFKWNCFVFYAYYSHVVLHMIVWCLVFDSAVKDLIENREIDLSDADKHVFIQKHGLNSF